MGWHKYAPIGDIHVPYDYLYADAATRIAATGFVADDVGKLALQADDNSLWMLTAVTPTWLYIGGGSASHGFDRVVVVGVDGNGDYDSVQDAINYAVTQTPSSIDPWMVLVCPGTYNEDVTMADFVSVVGLGTRNDAAQINGILVMPATKAALENIYVYKDPGDGNSVIEITGGINSINNCQFDGSSIGGTACKLLDVTGATSRLQITNCRFYNDGAGNIPGIKTHYGLQFNANVADLEFRDNEIYVLVEQDVDDTITVFDYAIGVTITNAVIKDNYIKARHQGLNGGITIHQFGGAGTFYCDNNIIDIYNAGMPGMSGEVVYVFTGTLIELRSSHNRMKCSSASGNNYYASFAGPETAYIYFDDIEGLLFQTPPPLSNVRYIITQDAGSGVTLRCDGPIGIDNPPSAKAFDQGLGVNILNAGVPTVLVLDNELWDTDPNGTGFYNPATGQWTVPVGATGDYAVKALLTFDTNGVMGKSQEVWIVDILVNGASVYQKYVEFTQIAIPPLIPMMGTAITTEIALNAGDIVTLQVMEVYFNGILVGDVNGIYSSCVLRKVR